MSPTGNVSFSSVRSRTRAPGVTAWRNLISEVLAPPSLVSIGGAELSLFPSPHPSKHPIKLQLALLILVLRGVLYLFVFVALLVHCSCVLPFGLVVICEATIWSQGRDEVVAHTLRFQCRAWPIGFVGHRDNEPSYHRVYP